MEPKEETKKNVLRYISKAVEKSYAEYCVDYVYKSNINEDEVRFRILIESEGQRKRIYDNFNEMMKKAQIEIVHDSGAVQSIYKKSGLMIKISMSENTGTIFVRIIFLEEKDTLQQSILSALLA